MTKRFADFNLDDEDDYDGEEEPDKKKFRRKTNAVIYLIDARKKMFSPPNDGCTQNAFLKCMECIRSAIRNKIYAQEKTYCGILLLGTEKTENQFNCSHISVVQPLKILGADHVLKIDEIVKVVQNKTYEKDYGFGDYSLADGIWLPSKIFSEQTADIFKSIILFTNEDNPIPNNQNELNRVIQMASDMALNSISLDLIHLGDSFDINKFYKELLQVARNDFNYVIPNPATKMEDMLKRVSKTSYRHVTFSKLPFFISDDFVCGVSIHHLVSKVKPPYKIKLSKSTNEKVVTRTQFFESETGEVVDDEHLIKTQNVGLKNIAFTKKELTEINEIGERGLRLMGFKPTSVLRLEHFVKPCAFIYPEESEYKGSTPFLTALLKRCLAKDKVAICTYYPRTTSSVRFVALIPQEEVTAEDNSQRLPPGFLVYFLPFSEEVRDLDEKCVGRNRASAEQTDAARKLMKKLKFRYTTDRFNNPKIKNHWAAIEALALDLKEPEKVSDCTIPDYARIQQRTHEVAENFKNEVYPDNYDPRDFAPGKRPRPKFLGSPKEKLQIGVDQVEKMVREGNAEKLTNDLLKNYLKSVGEEKGLSKMKKSDLIEKVCDFLQVPVP